MLIMKPKKKLHMLIRNNKFLQSDRELNLVLAMPMGGYCNILTKWDCKIKYCNFNNEQNGGASYDN